MLFRSSQLLDLSVDQLTVVVKSSSTTSLVITNDRDLLVTSATDARHLVNLDSGIVAVFQNIAWVASVSSEWASQVFDGALNPYAITASGLLSISLPGRAGDGDEDTLTVSGGLRSWSGSISLTADEIDFLGGPGSVRAPGSLTVKATTEAWTYKLGTSAETGGGGTLATEETLLSLDLPTRDIAALADGFSSIKIGRAHV